MKFFAFFCVLFFSILVTTYAQIPTENLLFHYSFDNGEVIDLSGNDHHATIHGASTTNDRFSLSGRALDFDGTDDFIQIPYSEDLHPRFPFTISIWVKVDELKSVTSMFFANDETDGIYSGFWLGYQPTGQVMAAYGNGMGQGASHRVTRFSNTTINTDNWHHIVAIYHGLNDIDLYIDCEYDEGYYSGSGATMTYLGNGGVIGRNRGHAANVSHNGQIDDIRLYKGAITPKELPYLCYEAPCVELVRDTITVIDTITVTETLVDTIYTVYTDTILVTVTDTLKINLNLIGVKNTTSIKIYPDLANEQIIIFTGNNYQSLEGHRIRIYNTLGQLVYHNPLNTRELAIDLRSIASMGVYILQILNKENSVIGTWKILLE